MFSQYIIFLEKIEKKNYENPNSVPFSLVSCCERLPYFVYTILLAHCTQCTQLLLPTFAIVISHFERTNRRESEATQRSGTFIRMHSIQNKLYKRI